MAQIGWVEVTTENGANGYLWYLKSEHETRLRFDDYLETAMIEAVPMKQVQVLLTQQLTLTLVTKVLKVSSTLYQTEVTCLVVVTQLHLLNLIQSSVD